MARNPPSNTSNRYTRNQARRKLLMVVFGVLLAFVMYRYFFGGIESSVVATHKIERSSLYVGNKFNAGKSTFKESDSDKAKSTNGGVKEKLEIKDENQASDSGKAKGFAAGKEKLEIKDENQASDSGKAKGTGDVKEKLDIEDDGPGDKSGDKRGNGEKSNMPEVSKKNKSAELNPDKDSGKALAPPETKLNKTNVSGNSGAATNSSKQLNTDMNIASKQLNTTKNGTVSTYAKTVTNTSTVHGKFNNQTVGNMSTTLKGNKTLGNLGEVSKNEVACMNFRVKSLNKTNNRMCQQNISDDDLLTEVIKDQAAWKTKIMNDMEALAKGNPTLVSIDIGCGTGAFTLLAAKILPKVIAIDPYVENLRVLQRALLVTQKASSVKRLLGYVSNSTTSSNKTTGSVASAKLDVITKAHILANETVFVSVSLGGYELEALVSGKQFFNTTRICFVLVNFSFQRTRDTGSEIVKFMQGYGLHPYQDIPMKTSLKDVPATKFDSSVIFRGNATDCLRKV